ncbi:MAG: Gram-negative bacterial TonB protein C-terminal, partial [Candidatus Eremiobacteraeota bacterium]|nr:Gram-negative bacterial TonB protein C-terminal [Candidatus Eremiobacteraeota bacterium]
LFLLLVGCSGGGATGSCTLPDRAPQILNQVQPDVPAMAQQQGITGDVVVRVTVDASGAVTSATIASSPSAILNQAALSAARASTYQAGLQNCVPGGSLDVRFQFIAPAVGVRF